MKSSETFKPFRGKMLHKVGRSARKALQTGWLSSKASPLAAGGQSTMKFKGFKRGKGGYKVINRIGKRGIIFTAPPLNPFEFGRTYKGVGVDRSPFARKRHITDPARGILTVKFRAYLHASVQAYAERAINQTIAEMS